MERNHKTKKSFLENLKKAQKVQKVKELVGSAIHILKGMKGSIKAKLIMAFIIPILFILILGFSAYYSASESIVQTFTNSSIDLIDATTKYFSVIMENIQAKAVQLAVDPDGRDYYYGTYTDNISEENDRNDRYRKTVKNTYITDPYIGNIAVFTSYGFPIATYGYYSDVNHFEEFSKTEEG